MAKRKTWHVSPKNVEYTLEQIVVGYASEKETELKQVAKECADDGVQTIREKGQAAQSGVRQHYIDWGDYLSGWKVSEEYGHFKIHNPKKAGLTHLLEFGHNVTNKKNGKVIGSAGAYPHFMPTERLVKREYEKKVKEVFK